MRLDQVEIAEPGRSEVLVRTEYSGISGGTELLAYRGEIDPRLPLDETIGALEGTFAYPFAYGYSCVGRVERGTLEGERVFAFHPHQDLFVAPERDVLPLGAIDPRVATLFPLVETALQVTLEAGAGLGGVAAVIGLGPVGTLCAALLERTGAVVLSTRSPTSCSSFDRVSVMTRCFGPDWSAVMNGRLISVCCVLLSSIFAFSAASLRRCSA